MEIPPEVIAAKNELANRLIEAGLITGIDFGVRDEEKPDPNDVVVRIFVADTNNIPAEVQAAVQNFPFPVVVIQRVFRITTLPDTDSYRPVLGGVSVASSRFAAAGIVPVGTLGAIVTSSIFPGTLFGLSNWHVLCVDLARQLSDEIIQPEPGVLGVLPGSRVGKLSGWSFPETAMDGFVDAAVCELEPAALQEVADIGPVSGSVTATLAMQVRKRGRTTGLTFGYITGTGGDYPVDFPKLPAVTTSAGVLTTFRTQKNQIQIHIDFPLSIVFGEEGDSGSVVVDTTGKVVGLYWGSGSDGPGDPLKYGLANPAAAVESALGITF